MNEHTGGEQQAGVERAAKLPAKRHGRRPARSALTGPFVLDPQRRWRRFEQDARAALDLIRSKLPEETAEIRVGFSTMPGPETRVAGAESANPQFYTINRRTKTILLYRAPIQRKRGLHVDDAEHRRLFVGHCVMRAVSEYLGREPWELLPGYFEHY